MQNNNFTLHLVHALKVLEWILPTLFWLLLLFGFDSPHFAICTLIAAGIHELGHAVYLLFRHSGVHRFSTRANGFRMFARGNLSYREEMALAAAGPLFNLIFAALFFILSKFLGEYFLTLALFNLMTMFSNLAPIEGQDGYKIILALMSERSVAAERFLSRASFFTAALLSFIALYLIERLDSGYWIFALFSIYGYSFVQKSQKLAFSKNSGENKRF